MKQSMNSLFKNLTNFLFGRRSFYCIPVVLQLVMVGLSYAAEDDYPSRPIKLVVPYAVGTTPDTIARLFSESVGETLGTSVIIENRPGASGIVGTDYVVKSEPDGYTLLFADSSSWAVNPYLYAKLPYRGVQDFAPVIRVAELPTFLVINPTIPANKVTDLIDYARKNPGKLSYGSVGSGSLHHLTGEMFKSMAKLDILHVPYKGSPQVSIALLSGETDMAFLGYAAISPSVSAGKLRVLGIAVAKRSPANPQIPTIAESGLPGFDMSTSIGVLAPSGTSANAVAKLNSAVSKALASPAVLGKINAMGVVIVGGSAQDFGEVMKKESVKFEKLIKLSGAKIE
jgi:tripartite-type tricarboxylate transporter receptor subunit TctC